jgi:hypothetical protein
MLSIPISLYLILWSGVGMFLAYLYGRKTKQFRWREYFALIGAPVIGCLGLSYYYGPSVIYFFFASSVVGFLMEYLIGRAYHKTLNSRLWTYGKYHVGGYTSLLALPMWGVAGVVFWLVSQLIGL